MKKFNFDKAAGQKPATLLKIELLDRYFYLFLAQM